MVSLLSIALRSSFPNTFLRSFLTGALLLTVALGISPNARATDAPRIAILSGTYGAGHNSSANAIQKLLQKKYPNAEIKIFYAENYVPFGLGKFSIEAFSKIYQKTPQAYDIFFQGTMIVARPVKNAAGISHFPFDAGKLWDDIRAFDPSVAYSTHHFSTLMLIWLKDMGLYDDRSFKVGWLDTDFVYGERFFYEISNSIARTFMAHPLLTEERIKKGVLEILLRTAGLPVNSVTFDEFSNADRIAFLKEALLLPDDENNPKQETWINGAYRKNGVGAHAFTLDPNELLFTIASGGAGLGDYPTIVEGLVNEAEKRGKKVQIIAVCGENQKNFDGLIKLYEKLKRQGRTDNLTLSISGFVRNNTKLMKLVRSSHAFIGKSGSQSPIEAAIMGVPSFLLDVLGGQERWTAKHFKRTGAALIFKPREQSILAESVFRTLADPKLLASMKAAQQVFKDSYNLIAFEEFAEEVFAEQEANGGRVSIKDFPALDPKVIRLKNQLLGCIRQVTEPLKLKRID
jgi:UDP-N-acetylglucosamine:LPS N-acetylglucosamine transferase